MRPRSRGLLLLLSFVAAACGEDAPFAVGDALTEEEAAALAEMVVTQGFENAYSPTGPVTAPAAVPVSYEQQVEAPCPEGGTVTIDVSMNGDIDEQSGNADVTISQAMYHQDCSGAHEETGRVFTLNSVGEDPSTTFTADVTVQNESDFSYSGSLNGRIDWATDDDRSGSCDLGVDFEMTGTAEGGFSISAGGQVCGVNVSESLTVGAA